MKWYLKKEIKFSLPKRSGSSRPFELLKFIPAKKYDYVLNFWKDYEKMLKDFNVVALYAKKDTGKSWIGYLMIKSVIQQNKGNVIYGRIQELEKKNAKSELFKVFEDLEMKPYYNKAYGKDYICFENCDYTVRLVNISSYQSLRGAIGEDIALIWFDEINAYSFKSNFDGNFINIISTLGRKNDFKLLLSGNNETATNNPILSALQLKFNWDYTGAQIAMRNIDGINIAAIQLGYQAFNDKTTTSLAEKLAQNNPAIYNTFYLGISNTNDCNKIINLKEDYKEIKPLFMIASNASIFLFSKGEVKDDENNIHNKDCILVRELPFNYDKIINKYNGIKLYTFDPQADLRFKNAIILEKQDAFNFIEPLNQALKNQRLYFCDFKSNETFLEYIMPRYHYLLNPERNKSNDKQRTRK